MLYEMITGHLPIDLHQIGDDAVVRLLQHDPLAIRDPSKQKVIAQEAMLNAIASGQRTDPTIFVPDMPGGLAKLLLKSVSVRPEDRFQNPEDFSTALERITLDKRTPTRTNSNDSLSRVASLLNQARRQRQERYYTDALKLLMEARGIIKDDAGVALELARLYNIMGKPDEAVMVLSEAAKQHPNNHVIMRELGFSYIELQKKELALEAIERSLAINPNQSQLDKMVRRLKK
jgi:tetratricopeptide (TPR) repeat protein